MPNDPEYCVAAIGHDGDPKTALRSYDEVLSYLRVTRNALENEYADARVDSCAEPEPVPIGGFGIWLRNRWGSEVEVGVGRDVWFLFRLAPAPRKCLSDRPPMDGRLVFYLAGGHYSE